VPGAKTAEHLHAVACTAWPDGERSNESRSVVLLGNTWLALVGARLASGEINFFMSCRPLTGLRSQRKSSGSQLLPDERVFG
jgi:hypothetical protein